MSRRYLLKDTSLRTINNSNKYKTGTRWQMKSGHWVTVLGQADVMKWVKGKTGKLYKSYPYSIVEFDSGYRCVASNGKINAGNIVDYFSPTVCGVGIIGEELEAVQENKKPYQCWVAMLSRCYSVKTQEKHPTYKGCTVCDRWLVYKNFKKDIKTLKNYDEWLNNSEDYMWALDKDIKVEGNKQYGPDTCMFVTRGENSKEAFSKVILTGDTYIATRLSDGYEEEFTNQTAFAKKYNLIQGSINSVIHGREYRKQHRGWKFKIKEDSDG